MKPKIGITCKRSRDLENYPDAVAEHGGEPVLIASLDTPVEEHLSTLPAYIEILDGIILTGGGDIDSAHYFEERRSVFNVSRSRDALEIRLFQKAMETDIPVFGICRGIQVMSVAMWGNLYQDIDTEYPQTALTHPKGNDSDSRHEIQIESGSLLHEIIGKGNDLVNSAHHQAVNDVGDGFVVTARSTDGVIEAIENPSKNFVVGVQYHPERMRETEGFLEHRSKLFNAFIESAKSWQLKKNGG